ncbi:hypothetical protein O3M35_009480 [Rhynocoris fuscipes]|uniref:Uncharacterized protein n=1 Tax=Rhynocoris fuscipes TaxID=488301 RepID=A0AAW1D319_9HEMI
MSCGDIIRLSLRKPNGWGWELSSSASSPHIYLPTVQLVDNEGHLLAILPHSGLRTSASTGNVPRKRRKRRQRSVRIKSDAQNGKG